MAINTGKVVVGGLVAGVVFNVGVAALLLAACGGDSSVMRGSDSATAASSRDGVDVFPQIHALRFGDLVSRERAAGELASLWERGASKDPVSVTALIASLRNDKKGWPLERPMTLNASE
jgi:hypothetical protein